MNGRIPEKPPLIPSLPTEENRPLFSIMIPSYNCIQFLPNAIQSVLDQDLGPEMMQIEVIDDFSTDGDVAALVEKLGNGRVGFYQQEKNIGSLRNFETCINRAKGYYIHILHGDDFIKPGFYREIESLFKDFPECGSSFTHYSFLNEHNNEFPAQYGISKERGVIDDWLHKIASNQYLQCPAVVVKREVYEKLGSFYGVVYGEDWEMWTRIAANYKVAYSPKCLATYRTGHCSNITSS